MRLKILVFFFNKRYAYGRRITRMDRVPSGVRDKTKKIIIIKKRWDAEGPLMPPMFGASSGIFLKRFSSIGLLVSVFRIRQYFTASPSEIIFFRREIIIYNVGSRSRLCGYKLFIARRKSNTSYTIIL